MKKKLLAVVMATVMAFSLVACGGSGDNAADSGDAATGDVVESEAADAGSDEAADSDAADKVFRVGLVTDTGGVEDQSFNQSAWEGLQRAQADFGVEINYLSSSTDADYAPNIETFIDEEYDLIISVGFLLADATRAAAEANPDVKFAIVDDSTCADLANVTCLTFKAEQASYLVGYVAGLMTEKDNIGFVLGMASDIMHQFGYGYCAGAIDANPNVTIQMANANNFGDPAMGTTLTTNFVTNGADVVYHAAGATGNGVISECQAKGIMAIGVDSDQSHLAPETVITSAMKRVDNAIYATVEQLVNGTITGGESVYDITNGGVDIAPTTDNLTEEVITAVNEVKEKLLAGEIEVPNNKEAFEAKYGDVYELDE